MAATSRTHTAQTLTAQTLTAQTLTATCLLGRHRARRVAVRAGATQTICLDCGCDLIRTEASRRWFYSGTLA